MSGAGVRVTGWISASGAPDIEVDPYVPVTATFPGYRTYADAPRSVVLRGAGAIVELKVRAATGELVEVVVPSGVPVGAAGAFGVVVLGHEDVVPLLAFPDDAATYEAETGLSVREDAVEIRLSADAPVVFGGTAEVRFGCGEDGGLVLIVVAVSAAQAAELLEG
jgi:hypothetical protein